MSPRHRRLAIGLGAAVVLPPALLLIALHLPLVQRALVARAISSLRASADVEITVQHVRVSPTRLALVAEGVRVAPLARPEEPLLVATRVDIDVARVLLTSRGRDLAIQQLVFDGPVVTLRRDASGNWNLPRPSADSTDSVRPVITLGSLRVHGGRILIDDQLTGQHAAITDLTVSTHDGEFATAGGIRFSTGTGRLEGTLVGDLRYDSDVMGFGNWRVQVNDSRAVVNGSIDLRDGTLALDASLELALDDLAAVTGLPGASGTVSGQAQVSGTTGAPEAVWTARGENLTNGTLPPIRIAANGRASLSAVDLTSATLEVARGQLSVSGRVGLAPDASTTLAAIGRGVELRELLRDHAPSIPLVASLDGRASVEGPGVGWRAWSATADLHVRASSTPLRAGEVPVDGVVRAGLANGRWTLEGNVASADAAVMVMALHGAVAPDLPTSSIRGAVHLAVDDLSVAAVRFTGTPLDVAGRASVEAQFGGTFAVPRAAWTLSAEGSSSVIAPVRATAAGVATPNELEAATIEITSGASRLSGQAALGWSGARRLSGRFDAVVPDVGALLLDRVALGWPLIGAVDAKGTLAGTLSAPTARIQVAATHASFAGQSLDLATGAVVVRGSLIELGAVDVRSGAGRLSGTVALDTRRRTHRADVSLSAWPLRPVPASPSAAAMPLAAELTGSVDTSGSWMRPTGAAALDVRGAAWDGHDVGAVDLRATADGSRADLTFDASELRTTGRGAVTFGDGYAFDLAASVDGLTLEAFRPWLPTALETAHGRTSAEVTVTGRATDAPSSAVGTVRLTEFALQSGEASLSLESPAVVEASQQTVRVDGLVLRTGDLTARMDGSLGRTASSMPLTLHVTGAAGGVRPWADALALQVPQVDGLVDMQVTVAGTIQAPRPAMRLTATDVAVALDSPSRTIDPAAADEASAVAPLTLRVPQLQATLSDGLLTLHETSAAWEDARVTASGQLPLRVLAPLLDVAWHRWLGDAPGVATVSARTTALDTRLLTPFLAPGTLDGISGRVTAALELAAETASWAGVSGRLTLDEASFVLAGLPLAQARPTVVRLGAGQLVVKDMLFSGPNTDLSLDGVADIAAAAPTFEARLRGLTDLAILRPFVRGAVPGGRAEINLLAEGSVESPSLTGELLLTDASLRLAEPRIAAEQLNGTATFSGRRMTLPALTGVANGAPVTLSAALALGDGNIVGGQVRLRATGLPVEYPEGLRSETDVDLIASVAGSRVDVTGAVDVLRGTYRDPIALTTLTTGLLSAGPDDALLLDAAVPLDVRFDIRVQTRDDVIVDNNYGRFAVGGAVRLLGTLDSPALSGRLTLREGGELYLSGLTYRIERGAVDFANPSRIEPIVDLAAETRTRGQRVRIEATGTPDAIEVNLSAPDAATPPSQAELASLLVSGRSIDDLSGVAAGEQALGLLSADLLGVVGRGVGLDALRLDRDLLIDDRTATGEVDVAAETDPVARLTLAKRLRSNVEVVFSQNLRDASEITWLVTWRPFGRTEARLLQRDDRSTSYEFRHEIVFGATPAAPRIRTAPTRVRSVDVATDDPLVRDALRRRLSLDAGDRFDFYRWQSDRDRLESWLHAERFHEHRLVARRTTVDTDDGPAVDLRYDVTTGPRARLEVVGASLDPDVLTRMREAWQGTVFDGFLQDDLARLASEALLRRGHPTPTVGVTTTLSSDGREKTALISVDPGPAVEHRLDVTGIEGSLGRRFDEWLAAGADRLAWLDPSAFESGARTWLRNRGALEATVTLLPPSLVAGAAVRAVRVADAVPYQLGRIVTTGVPSVREASVRDQLGLTPDDAFDVIEVALARRDVERWYVAQGFRQASVTMDPVIRRDARAVDLDVRIEEGPRAVIVESLVEGARRTQRTLLNRALALPVGTIATPEQLLTARKRLYDTGVLAAADVETAPSGPPVAMADGTVEQPVVATAIVRELPRLRFRYGLAVNDDVLQDDAFRATESRRVTPGLSALLENRNMLGRALTGGVSARYERARQTGRAFVTWPSLFGRDARLQGSTGITRSRLVADVASSPIDLRTDATIGLTQRLPGLEGLRLTYGYRYERSRTYDPNDPDLFDITVTAPRLTSTVFVDRRDDATAATRGWFHASTVELSRGWVGSDFEFVKYYAQQSAFQSIGRVVLAGRAQLGLGRGFGGQNLIGSERFFAGGAVSVRGYGESVIGELDPILGIARGDGLVVLNGEVRVPVWRWIAGVGFVDAGGVYERVSDIGLRDMQWGTGAGVRVSTPAGLFRIDFGVPLDRRATDKAWRLYVGLGHVF